MSETTENPIIQSPQNVLAVQFEELMHPSQDNNNISHNNTNLREWELYEKAARLGMDADPLLWWKVNENKFPILAQFAKKYLAIPASQASTERLFSLAKRCVSDLRTSLDPSTVEELVLTTEYIKQKIIK